MHEQHLEGGVSEKVKAELEDTLKALQAEHESCVSLCKLLGSGPGDLPDQITIDKFNSMLLKLSHLQTLQGKMPTSSQSRRAPLISLAKQELLARGLLMLPAVRCVGLSALQFIYAAEPLACEDVLKRKKIFDSIYDALGGVTATECYKVCSFMTQFLSGCAAACEEVTNEDSAEQVRRFFQYFEGHQLPESPFGSHTNLLFASADEEAIRTKVLEKITCKMATKRGTLQSEKHQAHAHANAHKKTSGARACKRT